MRLPDMADFCPTCAAVNALMLARGFSQAESALVSKSRPVRAADKKVKKTVARGATTASRKLSKALKTVNAKARKKNGAFKKGYTQSRIMRDAQRLAKRL